MSKLVAVAVLVGVVGVGTASLGDDRPVASAPIVAQVGNVQISLDRVEQSSAPSLTQARGRVLNAQYQYYVAQHEALEKLIDKEVLEQQARKENISVEELLRRHIKSTIKDPGEETMRIYYIALQTDQPYSELRGKIRDHIRELEERKLVADYVKSLRAQDNIQVMLDPPREDVVAGATPMMGPATAPVTVVEFADYQCPYCRGTETNVEKLRAQFKNQVRYSYRDFPLPNHQYAEKAAEASRCAADQGKFWQYHDLLFTGDGSDLNVAGLKALASKEKLDTAKFDQCLDSNQEQAAVEQDLKQGESLGVSGTPSFFINGYFVSGAVTYETLRELVQQQIAATGAKPGSELGTRSGAAHSEKSAFCNTAHPAGGNRTASGQICRIPG
ncbi:MAG: thioredoxin domain-containing protein [Candidatus Binataceae bacterium]